MAGARYVKWVERWLEARWRVTSGRCVRMARESGRQARVIAEAGAELGHWPALALRPPGPSADP
jgi:hypothetical protein